MEDSTAIDLLQLADIARDRTARGRARLFALLAALLCQRWSTLTMREREMLGELLVILAPRGEPADRERLARYLATRPTIPSVLQPLVILPPAPLKPDKAGPTITVNVLRRPGARLRANRPTPLRSRPLMPPVISARRDEDHAALAAGAAPPEPLFQAAMQLTPRSAPASARPAPLDEPAPEMTELGQRGQATTQQEVAKQEVAQQEVIAQISSAPERAGTAALPVATPISPKASDAGAPAGQEQGADSLAARAESTSPLDEMLAAPRLNPHRVTTDLLRQVLIRGDLPRFEVMLAHLCKLRAPLLRRLLRDGGSESFAILGRAAGLDANEFDMQWRDWRRQMSELDRLIGPPDRRDAQRIGAFFAALTDQQVDRLIQRWRSDGARLFGEAGS